METAEKTWTGEMRTMGTGGDTRVMWDAAVASEVDAARTQFNTLTSSGYMAYRVREDGKKGDQITEFDKEAGKIILVPAVSGG